ncbi:MAG TPA: MoaD/ThiS family protein [Nitrososphaeraceae archaeon]|nr:MoaD/ThiS family protein [Nitrososphaeraceae archaeon]
MIDIKLLGGIRKAAGKANLVLDKHSASVSEILGFLRQNVIDPKNFDAHNILVTINGADSSLLSHDENIVKSGDTVKIVTIVHGG